jgi:hypothetical protein
LPAPQLLRLSSQYWHDGRTGASAEAALEGVQQQVQQQLGLAAAGSRPASSGGSVGSSSAGSLSFLLDDGDSGSWPAAFTLQQVGGGGLLAGALQLEERPGSLAWWGGLLHRRPRAC